MLCTVICQKILIFSFVKNIKINKNDVRMSSQQGVIQILDILAQMFVPKHPEFLPRPKKNPSITTPPPLSNENLSRQGL